MQRYKLTIAYDGTAFSGYQIQPNGRTIQAEIEKILKRMSREFIRIHASGRTDAGVHAEGQVIHFDFPLHLEEEALQKALNTQLPSDILVHKVERVSQNFHARFDALNKTYHYRILNSEKRDPFKRHYTTYHPYRLNFRRMEEAMAYFRGTHDFTSFSSVKTEIEDKVRTIYDAKVEYDEETEIYTFIIRGNGFLYNMVRIMSGVLIEVGDGRREPEEVALMLEAKDRNQAGITAPPEGLCLMQVNYK